MSEEEIIAALSIEVESCGTMGSTWDEVSLMWNGEAISTVGINHDNGED